jgi:hypothetical protein
MRNTTRAALGALAAIAVTGGAAGAAAHGSFHAATLPNGDMQITAVVNTGQP